VQRHFLLVRGIEREPQQFTQTGQHPVRGFHVLEHEGRDGVQRVEQEMWVELHPQRMHLSAHQFHRQTRRLLLALP